VLLVLASCGNDIRVEDELPDAPLVEPDADRCATSTLDYQTFGAPFLSNWCTGCHGRGVPADMRQDAPSDVNLDQLTDVPALAERIQLRATGATPTMPPAGGPSDEERALLAEWIRCGARP
jgi:uncharacterized membrane protein